MVYAMLASSFLGSSLWAHHMFQSRHDPTLGTRSAVITTVSSPCPGRSKSSTGWDAVGGHPAPRPRCSTPCVRRDVRDRRAIAACFMATTAVDVHIHDTYFIVAHIHYVLFGGAVPRSLAASTSGTPRCSGRMYDETLGKLRFLMTFICFNATAIPGAFDFIVLLIEAVPTFLPAAALFDPNSPLNRGEFDLAVLGFVLEPGGEADFSHQSFGCGFGVAPPSYCQRLVTRELDQANRILDRAQQARVLNRADSPDWQGRAGDSALPVAPRRGARSTSSFVLSAFHPLPDRGELVARAASSGARRLPPRRLGSGRLECTDADARRNRRDRGPARARLPQRPSGRVRARRRLESRCSKERSSSGRITSPARISSRT